MNANGRMYPARERGVALLCTVLCTVAAFALAGIAAAQEPVSYSFTTSDQPYGSELAPLFSGYPVAGTFVYDPSVPQSGTVPNPPTAGSAVYAGAFINLFGSVAGNGFSDPLGRAVVGDDTYTSPPEPADILVLAGDPGRLPGVPPEAYDFSGFEIDGFTLQNARLFWYEGMPGIDDFLSDQTLPAVLPALYGRLALDFVVTGTTEPLYFVFFDLLSVSAGGQSIAIDIKPGDDANRLNPAANGNIAVAILTTDTFDALQVDPQSVAFGPAGASESHGRGHVVDVDADGDVDLLLHFRIRQTGIQCGDVEAMLSGTTYDGQSVTGVDAIATVACQ